MEKFKEYWKTVVIDGVEHPRYMVSNLGRVICLDWKRTGKPRLCKLIDNGHGYLQVSIDGRLSLVHRLVAEAFLTNPQNKHCIDHIFTLKTQNVVLLDDNGNVLYSTIRWCTQKENCNNMFTRRHLSENNSKPWNKGKRGCYSDETIAKMSNSKKGRKPTKEAIEKNRNSHINNPKLSKKVGQFDLDGVFICEYPSISEAARQTGISISMISLICSGKKKRAKGFTFAYLGS